MIDSLRIAVLESEVLECNAHLFVGSTEEFVDAMCAVRVVARMTRRRESTVLAARTAVNVVALRDAARRWSAFNRVVCNTTENDSFHKPTDFMRNRYTVVRPKCTIFIYIF